MNSRPPKEGAREWGDGATDNRPHVIVDIKFSEGWVQCSCGALVDAFPVSVEDAWDLHRGKPDNVRMRAMATVRPPLATDAEVGDFLAAVADPRYDFFSTPLGVSVASDDE